MKPQKKGKINLNTEQQLPKNNTESSQNISPSKRNMKSNIEGWNKASIIINALIMFFTAILLWQNRNAVMAAISSTKIADSTFKEVKRQFEVLNRPILQVGDIALANFKVGEKPVIIYKMENLGNFAAKVVTRKVTLGYVYDASQRKKDSIAKIEMPIYVSKETPFTENLYLNDPLEKEYYEAVIKKTLKLLAVGEIEYINEVTKEKWLFEFAIEIMAPPSKDFAVRMSDNKPIK
jgi:hypothetical protein